MGFKLPGEFLWDEEQSHPTVGVVIFGPKASDQLNSLSEELPVRIEILLVYSF